MKFLKMNGVEYKTKHLTRIAITNGKAVCIRKKEILAYDKGLLVAEMDDGSVKSFTTSSMTGVLDEIYVYNEPSTSTLLVNEEELSRWSKIIVALFDEEGAFLLVAVKYSARFSYISCMNYDDSGTQEVIIMTKIMLEMVGVDSTSVFKDMCQSSTQWSMFDSDNHYPGLLK